MENLNNLNNLTSEEKDYFELLVDFLGNGNISESERNILNKRKEKFGISDSRAKELEEFAKNEYLESKKIKFETEGEKNYYEFLIDMLEDGIIDERERNILNKRKEKYGISEARAKELEEFAKLNNGDNSNSLLEEGKAYLENEEYDKAINSFKKAVELNPNDYLNWHWLGTSYNDNKQYLDAINSLKKAVELNPDDEDSWYWLGYSYNQNGQYSEAIESLLKAVELNPNEYLNWYWLGTSYNKNEQYLDAINSLKKAVELNPNDYVNWSWLGYSYGCNGQYSEAIESLLKAVELNPDYANNWFALGLSYHDNGQYAEAAECYRKVLEIDPDNENAKENLEILQSANYGISGKSIVSGISKGIDTANQLASKVKPETIDTITKVGSFALGAAGLIGKFLKDKNNNNS